MKKEGQIRIPSGCAIAAVISKEGNRMSGEMIIDSMKPMHERSNGLGGGLPDTVFRIFMHSICFMTAEPREKNVNLF